jgi:hypothetical protein
MKKLATILSFTMLSIFTYAQDKFTYTLTFDGIDQFEVKKAVGVLDPLFENHLVISDDLQVFTYQSNKDVTEVEIQTELDKVGLNAKAVKREENE